MIHKYKPTRPRLAALAALLIGLTPNAWAFESNSTGADGAFSPTVDTQLQLPPDGVFNFTSVTIPTGVTVTFLKNVTNTPVTILASGDVTVDGTLSVNGSGSTNVGAAGDGNPGDDGLPGTGGPGGFDGGRGGVPGSVIGSVGLGPGLVTSRVVVLLPEVLLEAVVVAVVQAIWAMVLRAKSSPLIVLVFVILTMSGPMVAKVMVQRLCYH